MFRSLFAALFLSAGVALAQDGPVLGPIPTPPGTEVLPKEKFKPVPGRYRPTPVQRQEEAAKPIITQQGEMGWPDANRAAALREEFRDCEEGTFTFIPLAVNFGSQEAYGYIEIGSREEKLWLCRPAIVPFSALKAEIKAKAPRVKKPIPVQELPRTRSLPRPKEEGPIAGTPPTRS